MPLHIHVQYFHQPPYGQYVGNAREMILALAFGCSTNYRRSLNKRREQVIRNERVKRGEEQRQQERGKY